MTRSRQGEQGTSRDSSSSAGMGRVLGCLPWFWAVLLLLPYKRHILSSHSLIKLPFRRPAHTIDFVSSPFEQMCCLLFSRRGRTPKPPLSSVQALILHLPGGSLGHSIPWMDPLPPAPSQNHRQFVSAGKKLGHVAFSFWKAAAPGFCLASEVMQQRTPQQIKLKGPWPWRTAGKHKSRKDQTQEYHLKLT